jgi:hypothetical protein
MNYSANNYDNYSIDQIENVQDYFGIIYQADAIVLLDSIRFETDRMINLLTQITDKPVTKKRLDNADAKVNFLERNLNLI